MSRAVLLFSLILLSGCASERIVLLPSADGRASALVLQNLQGERRIEQILDQPYAVSVRRSAYNSITPVAPEQVQQRFAAALSARPPRARSYTLYFESGSDLLTPASILEFEQAKVEFQSRAAAEIMIIGHTDRVGELQNNDVLGQSRAEAVRLLLIAAGIAESAIETTSRGEREPLLATEDEVDEALNRRVEISLR